MHLSLFRPPSFAAALLAVTTCFLPAQQPEPPAAKARSSPQARPEPTETRVYKKVGGTELQLWIWKPEGWTATDKRSAVVFYHGGGWRNGSPRSFSRQSLALAQRGMVAISVQYRLTSQAGVTLADCVKDARSAFRWVRSHAAELGIDPAKIAAGGGSAGGHLAATLVTLQEVNDTQDDAAVSTMPAALLLFNPAVRLDFARAGEVTKEQLGERQRMSPFHQLKPGHPPTIIFHGEEDAVVPVQTVRDYTVKVKELGGQCELVAIPGQGHSFFNRDPWYADTLKQSEVFLEKLGLLGK